MKQIELEKLEIGRYYVGRGRNGDLGLWNGRLFLVIGEKFNRDVIKKEPYYTDGFGCFQPFKVVDLGVMVVPFRSTSYCPYGSEMKFYRDDCLVEECSKKGGD